MNAKLVSKEKNIVKFTFDASPEKLEEGMVYAYKKNKDKIAIQGFRKGKAPRKLIESVYGPEVFYDDAVNFVLNTEYEIAVKELGIDVVSRPTIDAPVIDKKEGIKFEVEVTVKPEVKLGQYKGVEYEKVETNIPENGVENELKRLQEQNSRLVAVDDRAAQNGDIVNISFDGSVDGNHFDGGKSDNYDLTLGSHTFIDNFEDQIVGHSIGDKFDVNVTFPENYNAEELKGKAAVFAVELKGINVKELPELNDEFAQDVSEFETLDEYKANIEGKLKETAEANAKQVRSDRIVDKVVENAEMDIPEVMYENKIDQLVGEFENNISSRGISVEDYCKYLGSTIESLRATFREPAVKSVKARLVLEQVAKEENINVTEEEIDEQIGKIAASYGVEKEKALEIFKEDDRKNIKEDISVRKAVEILENSAVEVEPKAE